MNRDSELKFEYDIQKRARAGTSATLRAAVALYLIYLGWSMIKGVQGGDTTMAPWMGWAAGLGFIVCALAFGFYTWKRYQQDLETARLPAAEDPDNDDRFSEPSEKTNSVLKSDNGASEAASPEDPNSRTE